MTEQRRPPEERFQAGGVSASVFVNEATRGDGSTFTVRKTVLQRTYVDASGKYATTSSLDVNDLPRAILVLIQAYVHCASIGRGDAASDDDDDGKF